jgi:hypothetical protein
VNTIWIGKEFSNRIPTPHSFQCHGKSSANRRAYRTHNRISRCGQLISLGKQELLDIKSPHERLEVPVAYFCFLYTTSYRGKFDFFNRTCPLVESKARSRQNQVSKYYDVDKNCAKTTHAVWRIRGYDPASRPIIALSKFTASNSS